MSVDLLPPGCVIDVIVEPGFEAGAVIEAEPPAAPLPPPPTGMHPSAKSPHNAIDRFITTSYSKDAAIPALGR